MSFIESVQSVFSHYATFQGRARRSEYWYFFLPPGTTPSPLRAGHSIPKVRLPHQTGV